MTPASTRGERWLWIALLLVTVPSRLWGLGARVATHDEAIHALYSLELARNGTYVHDPGFHGPLLYHVNAVVFLLFGADDFTARLAPALCGLALVGALWGFRRWLGRSGAFAAAVLVALSPTLTFYSRHLRNDVYIAFFVLVWVWVAFRFLEDRRPGWLAALAGVMGLAFVTKEVSFIAGALIGSFFLVSALAGRADDDADQQRRLAAEELALLMLTLVLPFAAGPIDAIAGWDFRGAHASTPLTVRGAALVGGLGVLAAVAALLWNRVTRRAGLETRLTFRCWLGAAALFWGLQVVFFTGFFRNTGAGLASGIAGSLGFWLAQHEVGRGGQPWFYYGLLGALYEYLPLVLAGIAMIRMLPALLRRDRGAGPPALQRTFAAFLVWWTLGSWLAFAIAGERMPWLLVHMTLPLCLLAGYGMAQLARGRQSIMTRATLLLVVVAALLTLRTSWQLNVVNYDLPVEPISYAQGSPDLRRAVADLERVAAREAGEKLFVAYDERIAWPLGWYLRDYLVRGWSDLPVPYIGAPVVLAGTEAESRVRPLLDRGYVRREYQYVLWPMQSYADRAPSGLLRFVADADARARLWRIAAHRRYDRSIADWPLQTRFAMWVRADLADALPPTP